MNKIGNKKSRSCFCDSIRFTLLWAKLLGILPIIKNKCDDSCSFTISLGWLIYSIIIIILYGTYMCACYGMRFLCHLHFKKAEWYIMTMGYFLSDLDCLVTIILGVSYRKKFCMLFKALAQINGNTVQLKKLERYTNMLLAFLLIYFTCLFFSYIYISIWRIDMKLTPFWGCHLLDTAYGVIIRGFSVIYSTAQISLVFFLCFTIIKKFEFLTALTLSIIENLSETFQHSVHIQSKSWKLIEKRSYTEKLDHLINIHNKIFHCLDEINNCIGLQLLIANSASLYAIICYLYRYSTSGKNDITRNDHEKLHYILGFTYRMIKMTIYMVLGQKILTNSKRPLGILQECSTIKFPVHVQQQVQTLILQWQNKEGYLSAYGIFRIGPWLLAPVIGNIITYLLVALQFDQGDHSQNTTATIESLF